MATQVIVLSERVLAKQVESILDLEEQIKSLKEQKDKLADNIKSLMEEMNVDTLNIRTHTITYKEVARNNFDTTKFKKEHLDIYKLFLKTSSYKKFEIE